MECDEHSYAANEGYNHVESYESDESDSIPSDNFLDSVTIKQEPNCESPCEITPTIVYQNESESDDNLIKCSICGFGIPDNMFENHEICHKTNRPWSCKICCKLFLTEQRLIEHSNAEHQVMLNSTYECPICLTNFQRASSLTNHLKIHTYHSGKLTNEHRIELNKNNAHPLPSISQIKSGAKWSTPSTQKSPSDNQLPMNFIKQEIMNEGEYGENGGVKIENSDLGDLKQCENCEEVFTEINAYVEHKQTCTNSLDCKVPRGSLKHACQICSKMFTTKQRLERHMSTHEKKSFMCVSCALYFDTKNDLDKHRVKVHILESTGHFCMDCGKSFTSKQGLVMHMKMHSPDMYLEICNICQKPFSSRQGFLIHQRIHRNERPYGCQFCPKAFRDGGTLKKHIRIHTGERPHECILCGKAFNQKVVLKEHIRGIHVEPRTANEAGLFDCEKCGYLVQDKHMLCFHVLSHCTVKKSETKMQGLVFVAEHI